MPDRAASDPIESAWSDVDATEQPDRFVIGLDRLRSDQFFAAQKERMHAALDLRAGQRVVDVGCGTGEDTATLARAGGAAIGVDRSRYLLGEARRRNPSIAFVIGDARQIPIGSATVDRIWVDRVVQHLADAGTALREWRRLLRPGGVILVFEPDVASARIDGLDARVAESVLAWRIGTRAGAVVVRAFADELGRAGFAGVSVEPARLVLDDLSRADSMMGLPDWGEAAGAAGALDPSDAAGWRAASLAAAERGDLRFSSTYLLVAARA
jgi:SAM-dependent methyltransferase